MIDAPQPVVEGSSGRDMQDSMPQMSGFLFKKSTNGEWQKRYFETNGSFLTYYKSQKMTKVCILLFERSNTAHLSPPSPSPPPLNPLPPPPTQLLAALSLPSVGGIQLIGEVSDLKGTGSIFQLDLKDRQYILRTSTLEEAQMWVDTLIQLRDSAGAAAAASAARKQQQLQQNYQPPGPNDPAPLALRGSGGGEGGFVKEPRGASALERCCICM